MSDPDPRVARWTDLQGPAKGDTYDDRWRRMEAAGRSVHGEADLVEALLGPALEGPSAPPTVLDAGCGTGRVAIELARRGLGVVGVDRDPDLLGRAQEKAPSLRWHLVDLADLGRMVGPGSVDGAVLAGNVLIFVDPGSEAAVLAAVAATVRPGGLVVAGFQLRPGGYGPDALDRDAAAVGLVLRHRWATWAQEPWSPGGDYQVSVHVVSADRPG